VFDLDLLARRECLLGVKIPPTREKPLTAQEIVNTGETTSLILSCVEEGGVRIDQRAPDGQHFSRVGPPVSQIDSISARS
jgi:hypothetical protein